MVLFSCSNSLYFTFRLSPVMFRKAVKRPLGRTFGSANKERNVCSSISLQTQREREIELTLPYLNRKFYNPILSSNVIPRPVRSNQREARKPPVCQQKTDLTLSTILPMLNKYLLRPFCHLYFVWFCRIIYRY